MNTRKSDNTVTPGLLWEMIKMKKREASINHRKWKKRNTIQKKDDIENSIKILEEQVANTSANNLKLLRTKLDKERREHELLLEYQTKDTILRSKSRWHDEGEKNTKYFLNLEIRHCIQGTIT